METLGNLALDRGMRYVNLDDNLRSLERKLQRLSGRKSDFELQVTNAERSGTKKRKREVEIWFKEVVEIEREFNALKTRIEQGGFVQNAISSGDRVAKMDATVEELVEQSKHFDGLLLENFESRGEPRVTTKLFGEMFDQGLKKIWAWLNTDNISKIGIYGMGGVGKTTLAKHIHNHLLEEDQFMVYWITVSQEFSIKKLQDDIAKHLRTDLSCENDEESRAATLSRELVKQSVFILDDVWQELSFEKIGIPIGANKCRVILTTRSPELCNKIRCQRVFEAKTLATNEAWDLFNHTLDSKPVLHGDLEGIAKSIVKKCAGLPLGIITVAGSMRGVSDICEWRNALKQLEACSSGHKEMERDVFPILEWSFNSLDECERKCFLYCSLYPEDSAINRNELIDLFIWAEVMPERNSRSEEFDQGHTILNKLIRVCLLEETTYFESIKCVKLHDLVRDMALRITSGNSKLEMSSNVPRFLVKSIGKENYTLKQKEWTEDLHAVSFHSFDLYSSPEIKVPLDWSPKCPRLSTLILSHIHIERIPDSFFRHMCGLKVLNLNGCEGITELPNSISDLVNLTALILGNCKNLRSMPPLGKLMQLRELDLSSTKIQDFPQGWESLVNLEKLNLRCCGSFVGKTIPKGTFSKLHRLQWLILPYGNVQVNDPEVLNQLKTFIGCLRFTNFHKISRWPECDYDLYVNDDLPKFYDIVPKDVDVWGCKQLYFHQCSLGKAPNNPMLLLLLLPSDVVKLKFKDCSGRGIRCLSDAFKNFMSLNDLSFLDINGLDGIEFLWQFSSPAPRDQLVDSSFSPLRNLKCLFLRNLPDLVGLFFGESEAYLLPPGTFSSLTCLSIFECHKVKQLFTVQQLQNLENLEDLFVHDCEGLEEIAADDNGIGQEGGEGIQLSSSEAITTAILPKLRTLTLIRLPQLENICKAAIICDSIKEIKIFDCPKLKRLPLSLPTVNGGPSPPSTLHEIKGNKEWWESPRWEDHCTKNAFDPFFTPQQEPGGFLKTTSTTVVRVGQFLYRKSR